MYILHLISFLWCHWLTMQVIVPLLVTEDEKTLVTCINCLTKVFPQKLPKQLGCCRFSWNSWKYQIGWSFINRAWASNLMENFISYCYLFKPSFYFFQLVNRLSQEELMAQLPSFLPALFEAFGNQSADVRKVNCWYNYMLLVYLYTRSPYLYISSGQCFLILLVYVNVRWYRLLYSV